MHWPVIKPARGTPYVGCEAGKLYNRLVEAWKLCKLVCGLWIVDAVLLLKGVEVPAAVARCTAGRNTDTDRNI